jgi:hypothetical protein
VAQAQGGPTAARWAGSDVMIPPARCSGPAGFMRPKPISAGPARRALLHPGCQAGLPRREPQPKPPEPRCCRCSAPRSYPSALRCSVGHCRRSPGPTYSPVGRTPQRPIRALGRRRQCLRVFVSRIFPPCSPAPVQRSTKAGSSRLVRDGSQVVLSFHSVAVTLRHGQRQAGHLFAAHSPCPRGRSGAEKTVRNAGMT